MSHFRVFLALELAREQVRQLTALQRSLARAGVPCRWVTPEDSHVTILFLGDVHERDIARLCQSVQEECAGIDPFPISLEGVGCFPDMHRPRVVWTGVGVGAEEITELNGALARRLQEAGLYAGDRYRFHPHVTLGRVNAPPGEWTQILETKANWATGEGTIASVSVMASELHPSGPSYSVLSRAALGG